MYKATFITVVHFEVYFTILSDAFEAGLLSIESMNFSFRRYASSGATCR